MTPALGASRGRLTWATWGLAEEERDEAVRCATAIGDAISSDASEAGKIDTRHFGTGQAKELALWLQDNPTAAILMTLHAPSWSRAGNSGLPGPRDLRSAAWPWGHPTLDLQQRTRCDAENQLVEDTLHLMDLALHSGKDPTRVQRPMLFLDTEDLGHKGSFQPASIWRLRATRKLVEDHGLLKSACYQCAFGPSARPKPTGLLHSYHLNSVHTHRGWPRLEPRAFGRLRYCGPLPTRCPCDLPHAADEGGNKFISAHFMTFLVNHLLSNLVKNTHVQELQEGGENKVLDFVGFNAGDELSETTDTDVEGGSYFEDPPKQDGFEADGFGLLAGSKGLHGSETCTQLPNIVNYLDKQNGQAATINIASSAVADIDFSGAQSTCVGTPDAMRQCSSSGARSRARRPAYVGRRVPQGGPAHASAVTRRVASTKGERPPPVARGAKRTWCQGSVPAQATAELGRPLLRSSRARPAGSTPVWSGRRTPSRGVLARVSPRRQGSVPPSGCSRVSPWRRLRWSSFGALHRECRHHHVRQHVPLIHGWSVPPCVSCLCPRGQREFETRWVARYLGV